MNPEQLSPEQTQQLSSWVVQRDALLLDIAAKKEELFKLTEQNKNLAESNSEIQNSILRSEGALKEVQKQEAERTAVISKELSDLLVQKTGLEMEIMGLKNSVSLFTEEQNKAIALIGSLNQIYDKAFSFAETAVKTFQEFSHTNSSNVREVEMLLEKMKEEFKKIIDVNEQNCSKAQSIMVDMPRIIFDLQRDLMERRHINRVKKA